MKYYIGRIEGGIKDYDYFLIKSKLEAKDVKEACLNNIERLFHISKKEKIENLRIQAWPVAEESVSELVLRDGEFYFE